MDRSGAGIDDARPLDAASIEAERRLIWMRLCVTATGTITLPFVADEHSALRWVAYALLAAGWVQSVACLVHERTLQFFVRSSGTLSTTAIDTTLTMVWVFATGGIESPWFPAVYAAIIWVSLHRPPRDTVVTAAIAGAAYLLMALLLDQLAGHVADVIVRIQYIGVVAAGSAIIARERLSRLTSRIALLDLTQQVGQIGTWEWSVRAGTLTWSEELYRIFGQPRAFRPTFDLYLAAVHEEDRAEVRDVVMQSLASGAPFRLDHRIVRPDGAVRSLHCRGRVVIGKDGHAVEMVGSAQDVTELRTMEAQLQLARKLASLGTLASGVAHEINNPLAYVASNLEIIERHLAGAVGGSPNVGASGARSCAELKALRDAVTAARHGSARMRDIVHGLKTFSRVEQEDKRAVDLSRVADLAIEIASHEITRRARLVRDYASMPPVPANESRLSQVLTNLLVNAAQAIVPGAVDENEIRVRIYQADDGSARIEVSDTGTGIAPENLERVFDPFFTTKATGDGTGLGLSICHGIVRDLGGDVYVLATGREGTTFRVSLPIAESAREERVASEPFQQASSKRKRVCIIDDEARYAESLRLLLDRDHDVTLASGADRALELIASGALFEVIFCDLMMPDKTGMDLYDELAAREPRLRERIVFITGGATSERAREFLARPEVRYVEKPVELAELLALIDGAAELPGADRQRDGGASAWQDPPPAMSETP